MSRFLQRWGMVVVLLTLAGRSAAAQARAPASASKEIDIMDETGMKNDKTKLGIYELDGDTYKFCLAPAGKPRPTEFTSKEGSGHSLGVSKREKP